MNEEKHGRRNIESAPGDAPRQPEPEDGAALRVDPLKLWRFAALAACLLAIVFCVLWLDAKQDAAPADAAQTDAAFQPVVVEQPAPAQTEAKPTPDARDFDVSGVSIEGKRIVIDPGHGGNVAGGTTGVSGRPEKEVNLEISLKLRDILEDGGATVIMTRETDASLSPTDNWEEDMRAREAIIAQSGADMFISIHQNEFEDPAASGPQAFFTEQGAIGKRLAVCIQDMMNYALEIEKPRMALEAPYRLLKTGEQPSCTVECGFMSNPEEDLLLQDDAYQNRVAQSIADGIRLYVKTYG
jgi:N-acetylmuramoyl-L-alanine amidase